MKIRYYGVAGYTSGYAHAANELCMALLGAGADLDLRYGGKESPDRTPPVFTGDFAALAGCYKHNTMAPDRAPDVVIVHAPPLDCAQILTSARTADSRLSVAHAIAYTTWEGVSSPSEDFVRALAGFDQVWVPCHANKRAFSPHCNVLPQEKIVVVPHSFDEESLPERRRPRGHDDARRPFRFYYIGHWNGRKNPAGLIRAWARAFTRDDDVELVMQSVKAPELEFMIAVNSVGVELRENMAPIKMNAAELSEAEIRTMHVNNDCFVSAARAEAWNLPAFHAVLAGRMVIATAGLGSDDFLHGTTAEFVSSILQPCCDDVSLVPDLKEAGAFKLVFSGSQGVTAKTDWRDPNLVALAAHMRHVYDTRRRTIRLDYNPIERFGRKAVGALAMTELERIHRG